MLGCVGVVGEKGESEEGSGRNEDKSRTEGKEESVGGKVEGRKKGDRKGENIEAGKGINLNCCAGGDHKRQQDSTPVCTRRRGC